MLSAAARQPVGSVSAAHRLGLGVLASLGRGALEVVGGLNVDLDVSIGVGRDERLDANLTLGACDLDAAAVLVLGAVSLEASAERAIGSLRRVKGPGTLDSSVSSRNKQTPSQHAKEMQTHR